MAKKPSKAEERNARIREQQRELSEERRARSLRFEDFASEDTSREQEEEERIRFQSIGSGRDERNRSERSRSYDHAYAKTNAYAHSRAGSTSHIHPIYESDLNEEPETEPEAAHASRKKRKKQKEPKEHQQKTRKRKLAPGLLIEELKASVEPVAEKHEGDFAVIACMVCLLLIGVIMITSSSYYYAYNNLGDTFYFLKREMIYLCLGFAVMIAGTYVPLGLVKRFSSVLYLVTIGLLVAVLFVGVSGNGSTRWLAIGPIQFQPSEIAKLAVLLFVSEQASQRKEDIEKLSTFLILLVIVAIPAALVAYQNLSSGLIIAFIGVAVMLVSGCRIRYFFLFGIPAAAIVAAILIVPLYVDIDVFPAFTQNFLEDYLYRTDRVKAWLDPFAYAQDEAYQIVQSLYAIASGGLFGQGLGESIQKLGFIPESYNDMVFSIICDELGLIGAALVIALFVNLIWHGCRIAFHAPTLFTSYIAAGLMVQIGIQAVLNIAVSTNSIPATGVSLPFISYGGTSLIFLMAGMGLLLNVSRFTRQQEAEAQGPVQEMSYETAGEIYE